MKWHFAALTLMLSGACAAAQADPAMDEAPAEATVPAAPAPVAVDPLGPRLLAALAAESADANVAVSPFSLQLALGLLLAGAEGATRDELAAGLGAEGEAAATLAAIGARQQDLLDDDSATLRSANGVWSAETLPLRPEYAAQVADTLGAEVGSVDFSAPDTLAGINDWFGRKTGGLIPRLLDRLPAETAVVLGNAMYFKGKWAMPFDAANTQDGPFQTPQGEREVPLMRRAYTALPYRETPRGQAVRLDFSGGRFELLVILPAEGLAPAALLGEGAGALDEWVDEGGYAPRGVELTLPKLDLESAGELLEPLRAAGFGTALGEGADYGALSEEAVAISRVIQKVVLKMDEAGAEAAAATAAIGVRSAVALPERAKMTVNRPYLLMLRHKPTAGGLALALVRRP